MKIATMESYLFAVYLQEHVLASSVVTRYGTAARRFDTFAGKIRRLDERHIDRFRGWLVRGGYSASMVCYYTAMAKALARHWFPRGPWRQPVVFLAADTPGSLDEAFVSKFSDRHWRPVNESETRRRYGSTLTLFGEYLDATPMLTDLTSRRVTGFLTWLVKKHGFADWTAANHSQRIGSLWRWAWRNGLVENPPTWRASGARYTDRRGATAKGNRS